MSAPNQHLFLSHSYLYRSLGYYYSTRASMPALLQWRPAVPLPFDLLRALL
jgi:hypothetical protein